MSETITQTDGANHRAEGSALSEIDDHLEIMSIGLSVLGVILLALFAGIFETILGPGSEPLRQGAKNVLIGLLLLAGLTQFLYALINLYLARVVRAAFGALWVVCVICLVGVFLATPV